MYEDYLPEFHGVVMAATPKPIRKIVKKIASEERKMGSSLGKKSLKEETKYQKSLTPKMKHEHREKVAKRKKHGE